MKRSIIIFFITFFWFGIFAVMGIDLHHDGVMFIPAVRVAENAVVFRDVFCQYGLLSPLLQGVWLKIFGTELLALKALTILFYAGSAVVLDKISRSLLSKGFDLVPMAMFWLLMPDTMVTTHPWSSVFALFFSLAALRMLQRSFEDIARRHLWLAAVGVMVGLTFLARHPSGFFTACAVGIALTAHSFTDADKSKRNKNFFSAALWCGGGFFAVCALAVLYLLINGAWNDFFFQCFTYVSEFAWKRGGGGDWSIFSITLFPLVSNDMGFFNIIFAILPLCALWLLRFSSRLLADRAGNEKEYRQRYTLFALALLALGSWHQYYPVPCVRHLFWAAVPAFVIFALVLEKLWQKGGNRQLLRRGAAVFLVLLAGYCTVPRLMGSYWRLKYMNLRKYTDVPGVRGMGLTGDEALFVNSLRTAVAGMPEQLRKRGVMNLSEGALLSHLLPDSGFRHPQFFRIELYPDFQDIAAAFIRDRQPLILVSGDQSFVPGYREVWQGENIGVVYRLLMPVE